MYEASCIIGAACMIGILLVFILLIKLTGLENWRIILNQTLSTYMEIKQIHPGLSDKEVFMNVLDDRYKMKKYYAKKEKLKDMIEQEIEEGRSILNTYNLPILIYISLIIEKNKILKTYSPAHNMLAVIKVELRRQGFLKYV